LVDVDLYSDRRGRQPVAEYVMSAVRSGEAAVAAQLERLVDRLETAGPALGMPYSRMIDRSIRLYELRFGPHRVAYVEHEGRIVLLHAWRKRSQALDERAARVARRRAVEVLEEGSD
jgi:phage-related protein